MEAIKSAINECDMGLLLISHNFIASDFINTEELDLLLTRRKNEGLLIVPIILGACLWQKEKIRFFGILNG